MQLGYEPFPLTTGKVFIFAGREAYFLPNVFKYLGNIYKSCGLRTIFIGVDAFVVANVTGSTAGFMGKLYIDRYYPNLGGIPEFVGKEESQLTDHQSFRMHLRMAVRDSLTHGIGLVVSRPFTVIMVREIAQLIGGENKYTTGFSSLFAIGYEEGPKGFFAGLVSSLIAEGIIIWGGFAVRYALERALQRAELEEATTAKKNDDKNEKHGSIKEARTLMNFVVPYFVNSFAYPFQVVSTVMALTGSGLAVSLLPYSPAFDHWADAYDYLKPHGLVRGSRMFLREQKGAVTVGSDRQLYAQTRHYV